MSTDTSKYVFNHSMLRVKDPKASVKFYEHLGMKQINKMDFPENKFSLYFLAYDAPKSASPGAHWTDRQGKGFGHICVSVDNIQAACKRMEDASYKFQKRLMDGRMKHIAFALDPDGYWVEIIGQNPADKTEDVKETDPGSYRFNHTMIRVKSATASLKFYQETMGMTLLRTAENPDNKFNLYFLGYHSSSSSPSQSQLEGLLELTYNYGTDEDKDFKYHDGNTEPQGFGHIAVAVDDLDAACKRLEEKGVSWKKRLTEGRMKNVAFVLDPDGYWIEVIQNQKYKDSNL